MDILEKYNIDPYEVLDIDKLSTMEDIKKSYKAKALLCHPDKTNGTTEAEFKILVLCYKYAKKNCIVSEISSHEQLLCKDKDEIETKQDMNIYNTDFENKTERSKLFSDDQIDFDQFKKKMERVQNLPTSYTAETFYKEGVINKMKTKGKFDLDKFNAFFLKLKKEGKTSTDLVKVERVKALNEDDLYMKVNIYDGMVVNTDDTNTSNYKDNYIVTQNDVDELLNTDLKTIDNLILEHKQNTDKISKKKLKDMISKRPEKIAVKRDKTFSQMEKDIEIMNIVKIQNELQNQKKNVDKYKNIYTKTLPNFIA